MGYTHYYNQKPGVVSPEVWTKLQQFALRLIDHCQSQFHIPLVGPDCEPGTDPVVSVDSIEFNGLGEDGHESLWIPRDAVLHVKPWRARENDAERYFCFCKTARKPYDIAVVAILEFAQSIGILSWSSDGSAGDTKSGRALAKLLSK